jgi:hypothetical protein
METENDRLHAIKDQIPVRPKNDIVRSRGAYPGEAGADWSYGATAKPEADEHRGRPPGLSGRDKQQGGMRDATSNMREPVVGEPSATQRSPQQQAEPGADVRGEPPMVQGTSLLDALPEGLQRDRKGPYDKIVGRNEAATQVPKNWNPKEGV